MGPRVKPEDRAEARAVFRIPERCFAVDAAAVSALDCAASGG